MTERIEPRKPLFACPKGKATVAKTIVDTVPFLQENTVFCDVFANNGAVLLARKHKSPGGEFLNFYDATYYNMFHDYVHSDFTEIVNKDQITPISHEHVFSSMLARLTDMRDDPEPSVARFVIARTLNQYTYNGDMNTFVSKDKASKPDQPKPNSEKFLYQYRKRLADMQLQKTEAIPFMEAIDNVHGKDAVYLLDLTVIEDYQALEKAASLLGKVCVIANKQFRADEVSCYKSFRLAKQLQQRGGSFYLYTKE